MPSPRRTAGRAPEDVTDTGRSGAGAPTTMMFRVFERRCARSRTVTPTRPTAVPAGTRTVQPAALRRSFVASAPRDQRNVTRMPEYRLRPRSWTWRPATTRTAWRQAGVDAGTQRSPVSRGAAARACAADTARSADNAVSTQMAAVARAIIDGSNKPASPK